MNKVKFTSIFGGLAMASLVLAMSCANPSAPENSEKAPDSDKVTITYESAHGIVPDALKKDKGYKLVADDLEALTAIGYTWGDWFIGDKKAEVGDKIDANTTLTAEWTAIEYTVKYDLAGGSYSGTALPKDGEKVAYDTNLTLPEADKLTKDRCNFSGWSVSDSDTVIDGSEKTAINLASTDGATVTLKALWASSSVPTLVTANLANYQTDAGVDKYYDAGSYTLGNVTADIGNPNHYTVKVNAKNIKRHLNGGEMAGYWAGIAMKAPNGAKKFREYSGSRTQSAFSGDWAAGGEDITTSKGLMPNIDEAEGSEPEGYACWGNKDTVLNDKAYFAVQWLNANGETLDKDGKVVPGVYYAFTLDLSGVTCKYDVANLYADLNTKVYNDTAAGNAKYLFGEKKEGGAKTIVMSDKFNYTYEVNPDTVKNNKLLEGKITLTSDGGAGYKLGKKETPTDVHVQITFDYVLTPKDVAKPRSSTEYTQIVLTPTEVKTGTAAESINTTVTSEKWADYGVGTALTLNLQQKTVTPTE